MLGPPQHRIQSERVADCFLIKPARVHVALSVIRAPVDLRRTAQQFLAHAAYRPLGVPLPAIPVERQPLEDALRASCEEVTVRVRTWPDCYVERLTADLGTDPQTATAILQEFADIVLGELGDLQAEGLAVVNLLKRLASQ